MSLAALAERRGLRFAAFAVLYASQGLPYGLLSIAIPAHLAELGVSAGAIGGYMGVILLPWSLKLLNGPVMDRWTLLAMGRRRPWILAAQLGMAVGSVLLALAPDPLANLALLTALGFAVNFFAAFQDVAVDGMAIEIIPEPEQARANGFMWGGKMLGIAGAAAGGAWMLNTVGFGATLAAHGVVVGAVMLVPLLLRERQGERLLPWSAGAPSPESEALQLEGWRDIGRSLIRAVALPASLVLLAFAFVTGLLNGLFEAAMPLLTVRELDWSDSDYAQLAATARIVSGVLGMVVGGLLVERMGRRGALGASLGVFLVTALAMAAGPAIWHGQGAVPAYAVVFQVAYVLMSIAFFATAMAMCWKRVGATQFALFMATSNLGLSSGSALLGPVSGAFGIEGMFFAIAACAGLGLVALRLLDQEAHRLRMDALEIAVPVAAPV